MWASTQAEREMRSSVLVLDPKNRMKPFGDEQEFLSTQKPFLFLFDRFQLVNISSVMICIAHTRTRNAKTKNNLE